MAQVKEKTFMVKLATFIVDKRNLFFLLTVIGLIFSVFSRNWVKVENDLTYYLPEDAETKLALNLMEEQFTTYGTAEVRWRTSPTPRRRRCGTPWRTSKASRAWTLTRPRTITPAPRPSLP